MERRELLIAGTRIEIKFHDTEFNSIKKAFINHIDNYYKDFLVEHSNKKCDFLIVFVWNNDIEIVERKKERKYYEELYKVTSTNSLCTYYQISFVQFTTILRHVLYTLLQTYKGYIFHGSAVLINGGAYVFTGNSGSGKSTVVKLLSDNFMPLADDNVIVKEENGVWYLYQTPFIEKNHIHKKNTNPYPLKKMFFLKKSTDFKTMKIIDQIQLFTLLQSQYFFLHKSKMDTRMLQTFINKFSDFYYLYFAKDKAGFIKYMKRYEEV